MPTSLDLDRIRGSLIRQEETLIFGVIERAQFALNPVVYEPGAFGEALEGESLVGYLLRETERIHARMRRYTSPDEHPFCDGLPEPILPSLRYPENPLHANRININDRLRAVYERDMAPLFCRPGDDGQYGSSAVSDVALLQALSKRVHYGKFVAESKFRAHPERFRDAIRRSDVPAIAEAIVDRGVEEAVLERVRLKAETYGGLLAQGDPSGVSPKVFRALYEQWIIPMNKDVQVAYLLERGVED